MSDTEKYEREEGMRALFLGLCRFWRIPARAAEAPSDPSDFCIPRRDGDVYIVLTDEPGDRQEQIAELLRYGNLVLVLDKWDLDVFRLCLDRAAGIACLDFLVSSGVSHATAERRRLGFAGMVTP